MNTLSKRMLTAILAPALFGGLAMAQKQAPQPATNVLLVHEHLQTPRAGTRLFPFSKQKDCML